MSWEGRLGSRNAVLLQEDSSGEAALGAADASLWLLMVAADV